jgi:glycosyltransferase involved in cell wall biosynthesis
MKKVLIIPSWQVWPLYTGGAHAQTFALNELSAVHEVHIILTSQNTNELEDFRVHFPKVIVHEYGFKKLPEKHNSKISLLVSKVLRRFTNTQNELSEVYTEEQKILKRYNNLYEVKTDLSKKIKTLDQRYNFDYVQYEMEHNIPLIFDYQPKGKTILVLHEVTSKIIKQQLNLIDTVSNRYHEVLLAAFRNYEKNNLQFFDKIITFNHSDKNDVLNVCKHQDIFVSSYGIFKEDVLFKTSLDSYNLLFTGSGHHFPNYHGLEWFLNHVMPMVLKSKPTITLNITGSWQVSFCERFKHMKQVKFLGTVSNEYLTTLYQENIMISPIFIGSGLRTKILSALSCGIPIVTTSLEKDLITDMNNGINCFLQDTPVGFCEAILSLLNDKNVRNQISKGAKELYEIAFDHDKLVRLRLTSYN